MAFNKDFLDPVYWNMRSGESSDSYPKLTESHKIVNNKIALDEIPDKISGLIIKNILTNETYYYSRDGKLKENTYGVNWLNGIVMFHPSKNGETVGVEYHGRGNVLLSANRVYTKIENGEVVETLQNVLELTDEVLHLPKRFRYIGEYKSNQEYYRMNIVSYNNSLYICVSENTNGILNVPPTNDDEWYRIATDFNTTGVYDKGTLYNKGDIVTDIDKTEMYLSITDGNKDNILEDQENWYLLVSIKDIIENVEQQERIRQNDELIRNNNEQDRINNELIRQQQEQDRVIGTATAISNLEIKTQEAKDVADEARGIVEDLGYIEEWKIDSTYKKNNIVRLSGSSFISKVNDNIGNVPNIDNDTDYWGILSKKGQDGTGTVTEVKSSNGDISIINASEQPDLSIRQSLKDYWNNAIQRQDFDEIVGLLDELDDVIIDYLNDNDLDINIVNAINYVRLSRSSKQPQNQPSVSYTNDITYGDIVNVSWTGQSVNGYKVDVSLDNGMTWSEFYNGTNLNKDYTVNSVGSLIFRVRANGDEFYFDSEWTIGENVNVKKKSQNTPTITYTNDITYGDIVNVSWSGQSVNGYTVEFSLNNGSSWSEFYYGFNNSKTYTVNSMGSLSFRVKANGDNYRLDSDWKIGESYVIKKAIKYPPSKPMANNITENSITVTGETGTYVRLGTSGTGYPSPHTFTGLTSGTEYTFYAYFPETNTHLQSGNSQGLVVSTTSSYKIYGVKIDETNSNPETAVTYTDDAIGMTGGSTAWDNIYPFNQIRPVLFKNGQVVGELDKNDFSKFKNGTNADITSGNAGDVMIEFPKIWWKFERIGNDLYVRYANKQIDSSWKCHAHTRGVQERDFVYIGAYLGYETGGKLRSLSGKQPSVDKTIGQFRTLAQANGSGYEQMPYFQLLMLQILYLIRYKNRDSQIALGRGYVDGNSGATSTGSTNAKGMYYGETTGKQQMKFSGIEDFWGNCFYWIDGLYSDGNRNLLIGTNNFNDTGSGYTNYGQGSASNISGYISGVQGGTETGFIIKQSSGSSSTYYSDHGVLSAGYPPLFGGYWSIGSNAGSFQLRVNGSAEAYGSLLAARLAYF